jgi:8-oxo-dGTP diphosphatase
MSNAYESAQQKVIPAVLLYAFYDEDVLMLHKRDHWNGLGGKLEKGESPLEAAVREFEEEAGLWTDATDWRWLGQLYFPDFKAEKNEDWWVTVYVIQLNHEQRKKINTTVVTAEGSLHFVPRKDVPKLKLWEGDTDFLPFVFKRVPFEGTFFYEGGCCVRKQVRAI